MTSPDDGRAVPSAPNEVSDAAKDRVVTLRAALLALVAALIAAGSSYFTARQQIQSQAKQSRSDFVRTQRKVAYSKMITDTYALAADLQSCLSLVGHPNVSQASISAFHDEVNQRQILVDGDDASVQVVGMSDAALDSHALAGLLDRQVAACRAALSAPSDTARASALSRAIGDNRTAVTNRLTGFVFKSRRDVQTAN
jgi:hypothetical protein